MKTHRIVVTRILAFGLGMLFLAVRPTLGQEVAIMVPNGYENTEGPDGNNGTGGYEDGYRLQGVFSASAFASLPPSHHIMTGFSFRPDADLIFPHTVTWPQFTLKLSTTTATPATINDEFLANIGRDETVVYHGPITLATANTGPSGGPKESDYAFEFQTPFHYDPALGNLLMDWTNAGLVQDMAYDSDDNAAIARWVFNEDRHAARANFRANGTPIIQFTFVPEPSTLTLAALALLGVLACCRRCRPV